MQRIILAVCLSILLGGIVANVGVTEAAGLTPRWTPPKPDHAVVAPSDIHELINVKFIQNCNIRMRDNSLVSINGYNLTPFQSTIAEFKIKQITRLFARAEHLLDAERESGQLRSGKELADLNNWYRVVLDPKEDAERFINALHKLDLIEIAYAVPEITVAEDIDPETGDFSANQGYLYEAPEGINAVAAWEREGGTGEGIKIIDIEFSWNLNHEDFPEEHFYNGDDTLDNSADHGDAVLGIMVGQHNEYGINGICPDAQIGVQCAFGGSVEDFANHINTVAEQLDPGDIFLIELQGNFGGSWSPMETWAANFDAIETATANGIFCLEAAGNGNSNLDGDVYEGRFDPDNRYSGAIMVGAGAPPSENFGPDRSRLDFSNYGQRVDLQGWGQEVVTTGGNGDVFFPDGDVRQRYTESFNGTSSATPIVVGAVACFQGIYKAMHDDGSVLSHEQVRGMLIATGTPQSEDGRQGHIGPRPDIDAALGLLRDPGMIYGSVLDAANDQPLQDVTVFVDFELGTFADVELTTDVDGNWRIESAISEIPFIVSVSVPGYNDSTVVDLVVEENDSVEVNIAMLHPSFNLSDEEILVSLEPNDVHELTFTIVNDGNGPLTWEAELTREENEGAQPWNMDAMVHLDNNIGAGVLGGLAIVEDQMLVPGGYWNLNNWFYILDMEGALIDSFRQFGRYRYGTMDLAYDGTLVWGGDDRDVYGFSFDGSNSELHTQFRTTIIPLQAIAWDVDAELLWVAGQQTNILGYTRNGEYTAQLTNPGFIINGMTFIDADAEYPLHILHTVNGSDLTIHKMNPENGDTVFVAVLEPEEGGTPNGGFVTTELDERGNLTFLTVFNNNEVGGGNRVDMYKRLLSGTAWLSLQAPDKGTLDAGGEEEFQLLFNSTELSIGEYEGSMLFTHNAIDQAAIIPITLSVIPMAVDEDALQLPTEFLIDAIYPNPFNSTTTISISLPKADNVTLELYDVQGRLVESLHDGQLQAGIHHTTLKASNMASGVYFVHLSGTQGVTVRKIALVR